MQRLPYHVRDMLSTRNPSDNWIKSLKEYRKMESVYYCSFCGNEHELSDLVSGPTVYICRSCVSNAKAVFRSRETPVDTPIPENFHIHSTTGRLVSLDAETLGTILDLAMEGLENCAKGSNGMLTKTEECAMGVINALKLYYPQLKD